jgi:isopenicillin N synthase-like dioxygenase
MIFNHGLVFLCTARYKFNKPFMMNKNHFLNSPPVIDISGLGELDSSSSRVAFQIAEACKAYGFFYVTGHGVDNSLMKRLDALSRQFFSLNEESKLKWGMTHGGRAWRGYFPLGSELTSGLPDYKEGLYLGTELPKQHPLVLANTPLHGANLFPDVPGLKETILAYMSALTQLGHRLMKGVALSLALPADYFERRYTADPLILFRLFNYPSLPCLDSSNNRWGVGEHSDYGLLTILLQDDVGGLQIKISDGWIEAPPIPGSFVCNIGDMLDFLTCGLYRSTPHRVVANHSGRDRLSFPFFFDPNFFSHVKPIESLIGQGRIDDNSQRWDKADIYAFKGNYGDYLLRKVSKVFPELRQQVLCRCSKSDR